MRTTLSIVLALAISWSGTPLLAAADTDGDGLLDEEEDRNGNGMLDEGETDWLNADTDEGGEADGAELSGGRDPFLKEDDLTFDRDGDGLKNAQELALGTNPAASDSDGDGVSDAEDPFPLDAAYTKDEDRDGLPDEYETSYAPSTSEPFDAEGDLDADGLPNLEEFIQGTDPDEPDTDQDGVTDSAEIEQGTEPLQNPCLSAAAPMEALADIAGHWSEEYVTALQRTKVLTEHARIVEGYEQGGQRLFLPDQPISRFELLKIALLSSCRVFADDAGEPAFRFSDVPSAPRPREGDDRRSRRRVIGTAFEAGIAQGYSDGTFRPDAPVNRAEALKILFLATRLGPENDSTGTASGSIAFADVPADAWFAPYVRLAAEAQIVRGYPDGTFGPEREITRAEAAKIVALLTAANPWVNGEVVPLRSSLASPGEPR